MENKIGIWIDTKKAVIITEKRELKTITSNIETRERVEGESKTFGRIGDQYIDPEKQKENRIKEQKKVFLQKIVDEVKDCEAIVVFGPANMKLALEKEINDHYILKDKLVGVESSDNMTENQMAAWVENYYKGKVQQ